MSRSRHTAGSWIAAVIAGALIGCAAGGCAGEPAATGVTVRDSAGIRIVENTTPLDEVQRWRLAEGPDVRIGMLDGPAEYQFYRIGDTRRLADGRIVVVSGGSPMLRIFGSTGEYLSGFGPEGEGPEEFTAPWKVWPAGDTLLVLDIGLQRFATWTADGRFLRVDPVLPRFLNEPFPGGRFSDGSLLLTNLHLDIPESGFEWVPPFLQRYGRDGALLDTIARYPGRKFGILSRDRGMVGSPHFSARTAVAARGTRVVVATGQSYEVELLDIEGDTTDLVRWTGPPRDVSDEDVARLRAGRLDGIQDPEQLDWARDLFEGAPVEPEFATTQDVGVATTGEIWVREFDRPAAGPGQRWLIFDPDGELIGRIRLPENLTGYEAGSDYILGVETDELDVEYVVLYRFDRSGTAP